MAVDNRDVRDINFINECMRCRRNESDVMELGR